MTILPEDSLSQATARQEMRVAVPAAADAAEDKK